MYLDNLIHPTMLTKFLYQYQQAILKMSQLNDPQQINTFS